MKKTELDEELESLLTPEDEYVPSSCGESSYPQACDEEDEVDYSPAFLEKLDAEGVKRLLEDEKKLLNKIKNEEKKNDANTSNNNDN